jgi:EmrB/QacA subfamily drug resistance transporter
MATSTRRSLIIAALVAGAFYMEMLDGTVIATALPEMARAFRTSPIDLSAGMSVYMLALAVFIPISGWVADRFGGRTVFASAIGVFTIASILCGLSNNLWQFIAARVVQGIGGAMMVPVGRLVVLNNTEKKDLMRAIAYITWPALVAPVLGPPLGGFITTYATWRWIFFLNVPLGLIGIVLSGIFIPNERPSQKPALDVMGLLLSGGTCTALMYGMDLVAHHNASWLLAGTLLALSLVLGALAIRHSRQHPSPLLDLSALRIRTFAVTMGGGSLFRIAIGAVPFLLPLMFQVGFGMSAFASGGLVLALFAGNLGMKPLTTPVLRRFGFRAVLIVNGLLSALAILACALLTPNTPRIVILITLFCGGLCRSMQFTSLNTLGFADVPKSKMSGANTFFSMVQQLTLAMGIAFGAVALQMALRLRGSGQSRLVLADFHLAFVFVAVIGALAVLDCFGLERNAGAIVSGHRQPVGEAVGSR